jgi:protein SCO1/2
VGPDLLAVAKKRDRIWLARWLKEPDKMLEEKDPLAMSLFEKYKISMPNMRLTEKDVENIIGFMEAEDKRLQ